MKKDLVELFPADVFHPSRQGNTPLSGNSRETDILLLLASGENGPLQFKILENKYSSSEIFNFMKEFNVVEADGKYINLATNSPFIKEFAEMTKLPLDHYILNSRKIEKVLNFRF